MDADGKKLSLGTRRPWGFEGRWLVLGYFLVRASLLRLLAREDGARAAFPGFGVAMWAVWFEWVAPGLTLFLPFLRLAAG